MSSRLIFVIPVFEPRLDLLSKSIKALCDQSFKEWSMIAVLDGQNEAAAQVIRAEMKKKPNSYKIVTQEHAGAQRARNLGAHYATEKGHPWSDSDFIVFWDYDCLIEPDTAATWVAQFDKHPEIDFVYSGYKFLGEMGAIDSEPFDPYLLRVRNYISSCFPVRVKAMAKWNEDLKSLQDWDFWLSVVENGGKGKYLPGYAFSTLYPSGKSISAEGCTDAVWLSRVDAVKKAHNLPERDVCVSSLTKKHEGVWLAKLIGADYQDYPTLKPHKYKTIVSVGFSFAHNYAEAHCALFSDPAVKKVVFWTCDDITEIYSRLNLLAIHKYSTLLNAMQNLKQYVEDKAACDMMTKAGFNVEVRPLPMEVGEVVPLPEKRRFAVDINPNYSPILAVLDKSLPDVELVPIDGAAKIADFTGLIHLHPDRTISSGIKRALLGGRKVISNIQAPFAGFVDDTQDLSKFIPEIVESIRTAAYSEQKTDGRDYYANLVNYKELVNAL